MKALAEANIHTYNLHKLLLCDSLKLMYIYDWLVFVCMEEWCRCWVIFYLFPFRGAFVDRCQSVIDANGIEFTQDTNDIENNENYRLFKNEWARKSNQTAVVNSTRTISFELHTIYIYRYIGGYNKAYK